MISIISTISATSLSQKFFNQKLIVLLGVCWIALIGACKLYPNITEREFWLDEVTTWEITQTQTLKETLQYPTLRHTQPPLFYVFGRYWSKVFGDSERALRSLSLFAILLLLIFSFYKKTLLFNSHSFVIRCLFLSFWVFSGPIIFLSQEFRPYAWGVLWNFFSSLFFLKLLLEENPQNKTKIAYLFTTLGSIYTLSINVPLLGAQGVTLFIFLCLKGLKKSWPLLILYFLVWLFYLPFFTSVLAIAPGGTPRNWQDLFTHLILTLPNQYRDSFNFLTGNARTFIKLGFLFLAFAAWKTPQVRLVLFYLSIVFLAQITFIQALLYQRSFFAERYWTPALSALILIGILGWAWMVEKTIEKGIKLSPEIKRKLGISFSIMIVIYTSIRVLYKNPYWSSHPPNPNTPTRILSKHLEQSAPQSVFIFLNNWEEMHLKYLYRNAPQGQIGFIDSHTQFPLRRWSSLSIDLLTPELQKLISVYASNFKCVYFNVLDESTVIPIQSQIRQKQRIEKILVEDFKMDVAPQFKLWIYDIVGACKTSR